MKYTGSEILIKSLLKEKVEVIFGYPGGANMPIYDALYFYEKKLRHVLVRHEQGAAHAAEGYARVTGKPGVCLVTSGPGATNLVTGIADAMMDSVPLVCITGQVAAEYLGSDAFQETDVVGITAPITKWNCQVTHASEIVEAVAKAFYIANHGRPGPVVIDITKNAQFEEAEFVYKKVVVKKLKNPNNFTKNDVLEAAYMVNRSKRPLLLVGHGVLISGAEMEVSRLTKQGQIPVAATLHGLSATSWDNPWFVGLVGMHGRYAPNVLTNEADLIISAGMRFDDRVVGKMSEYAPLAKIIHIDVDASEHNKNIKADLPIVGDVKTFFKNLLPLVENGHRENWRQQFNLLDEKEKKAEERRSKKHKEDITMDEVINMLSKKTKGESIVVADVGQNQMFSARFYDFKRPNSYVTSGGLGTMGFALPAAIGAMIGAPKRETYAVVGDGGFQMTVQELGTILQEKLPVKILILNNEYLGMVRQWQELFFDHRYSFTHMINPDFVALASAYGIKAKKIVEKKDLDNSIAEFVKSKEAYLLEVKVAKEGNIFPMIPTGTAVDKVRLE
ncbi:biosynthetic-type acetolactate synthase large subunit [Patescibacteria group bacterium]|nr:biosynthetic-type acetolactate synthase large subunit [Patescibacteria group bacterium]